MFNFCRFQASRLTHYPISNYQLILLQLSVANLLTRFNFSIVSRTFFTGTGWDTNAEDNPLVDVLQYLMVNPVDRVACQNQMNNETSIQDELPSPATVNVQDICVKVPAAGRCEVGVNIM